MNLLITQWPLLWTNSSLNGLWHDYKLLGNFKELQKNQSDNQSWVSAQSCVSTTFSSSRFYCTALKHGRASARDLPHVLSAPHAWYHFVTSAEVVDLTLQESLATRIESMDSGIRSRSHPSAFRPNSAHHTLSVYRRSVGGLIADQHDSGRVCDQETRGSTRWSLTLEWWQTLRGTLRRIVMSGGCCDQWVSEWQKNESWYEMY